jgi:hypothetical protein
MYFLLFVIAIAAGIFLFYWLVIKYAETVVTLLVERKHWDAEMILNSGIAPPAWGKQGIARIGHHGLSKVVAMRKIGRIIKYFEHTPIVEDDESRDMVVKRLQSIKTQWKNMGWKDIYPYE